MNCSAGKINTIYHEPPRVNGLSTPPIGCVLDLPGLPGNGSYSYDRSPYGNHGTIIGAVWKRLPSGLWCLDFDGLDDNVNCGNASAFDITGSFSAWIWLYRDVGGFFSARSSVP